MSNENAVSKKKPFSRTTPRQRLISVGLFSFIAGTQFAWGISHYMRHTSDYTYIGEFLLAAGFMVAAIGHGWAAWSKVDDCASDN